MHLRSYALALAVLPIAASADSPPPVTVVYPDAGRFEVALYPVSYQLNAASLTRQIEAEGMVAWHATEGVAIQARFRHRLGAWLTPEGELVARETREADPLPPAISPLWWAVIGTEITAIERSGTLINSDASFELLVSGLVGAVRLQYGRATIDPSPTPLWLNAPPRITAGVALGTRVRVGKHVAVRVEFSDFIAGTHPSTLEGCAVDDFEAFDQQLRTGQNLAAVNQGCDAPLYSNNPGPLVSAIAWVRDPSFFEVLNSIRAQVGVSVVF